MRLACLLTQTALLLFMASCFCAMTSPWTSAGGGGVLLRAMVLQILLEKAGWFFGPPFALCVAGIAALLFCSYALGSDCARICGLLLVSCGGLFCLHVHAPRALSMYLIASAAMFLPAPARVGCRLTAGMNAAMQYALWCLSLAPGVTAWIVPWPEGALLLPVALALLFLFRFYASERDSLRAACVGLGASAALGLTMPPLAPFCALGAYARLLGACGAARHGEKL